MISVGEEIPSGMTLLQVAQLDQLAFEVPGGRPSAQVKVGESVRLGIAAEPHLRISALVSAIMLVLSQDQSAYTIRIITRNPSPSIVVAGLAEVQFPHSNSLWHAFPF
jgi:hypothetical protein